jgi:TrmH family RNA methyltransferase
VRAAERAFVVEGVNVLAAALEASAAIESLYVSPEGRSHAAVSDVVSKAHARGIRVHDLGAGVMERVADTVTPQGVCAVVGMLDVPLERALLTPAPPASSGTEAPSGIPAQPAPAAGRTILVCVDIRDPGNLGAVMRSADASGAEAVVCCEGTVDPYNPKVVRASAGSLFHVPIVVSPDSLAALAALASAGFLCLGASAHGGTDYVEVDFRSRVALVLGNEAAGLPEDVTSALDGTVAVPMYGRAESLNVAMAATVLCFEAARQRRRSPLQ